MSAKRPKQVGPLPDMAATRQPGCGGQRRLDVGDGRQQRGRRSLEVVAALAHQVERGLPDRRTARGARQACRSTAAEGGRRQGAEDLRPSAAAGRGLTSTAGHSRQRRRSRSAARPCRRCPDQRGHAGEADGHVGAEPGGQLVPGNGVGALGIGRAARRAAAPRHRPSRRRARPRPAGSSRARRCRAAARHRARAAERPASVSSRFGPSMSRANGPDDRHAGSRGPA